MVTSSEVLGLSGTALALLCAWVCCYTTAHVVNTNMNPLVFAVSEYGAWKGSRPFIMACWWLIAAVAILDSVCVTLVLKALLPQGISTQGVGGIVCLYIFAGARLLTSAFKTDVRVRPGFESMVEANDGTATVRTKDMSSSSASYVHLLGAIVSFVIITVASREFASAFDSSDLVGTVLHDNYNLLNGFSWAIIATMILMILSRWVGVFGLGERLFYVAHIGWLFALTITLVQFGRSI